MRRTGAGRQQRLWLGGILLVATVLRVGWILYAAKSPQELGDPFSYLFHAEDIADGKGYLVPFTDRPTAYYPVGYPAILGGVYWVARSLVSSTTAFGTAVWLNVVLGVATVALVYVLGRRLANRRVGLVAAGLVAIWPNLIFYTATAYLETVFTFLVAAALVVLLGRRWSPSGLGWPTLVGAGLLVAAATMVRPIALALVPVMAVGWVRANMGWSRALRQAGAILAVVVLVALPWSIRSTAAMNGLVLISTNNGDNLCIGHQPESTGRYHSLFEFCWPPYEDEPVDVREVRRDRGNARRALRYAVGHPGREASLTVSKVRHLVHHDHEGLLAVEEYGAQDFISSSRQRVLRWMADLYWYVVAGGALAGVIFLPEVLRRGDVRRRVLLASTIALLAVPLVFFGGVRFHVPAAPFIAVLAALSFAGDRSRRAAT